MHYNFVRIPLIDVEAFAKQLGDAREARSMTLQRFAKEVGVSTAAVWCWEKDRARPPPGKMKKIASVLKVTEAFSRTGTDTMEPEFDALKDDSSEPITSDIEQLHQKLALALGMLASQVKISVEFLSG
jgi:transcriptional regulator with XRE-family HTH domain